VTVVGGGAWGTTLATLLAARHDVALLVRREAPAAELRAARENRRHLPGVMIPPAVRITASSIEAVRGAALVVFAVPSAAMRESSSLVVPHVAAGTPLVSAAKGLEAGTLARMTEVLAEVSGGAHPVAALSGPTLAAEVVRGMPAGAVVAAADDATIDRAIAVLALPRLRLYRNRDVLGVELAGALKNVIAIAAGASDGLGFGDNARAGIITRGLAEMARLGSALGANPMTFAGLAGLGDLVVTCSSDLSRNRRLGLALARGRRWPEAAAGIEGIAEGAFTAGAALELAAHNGVELPIAAEVHAALSGGKPVEACVRDLLARAFTDELAAFRPGRTAAAQ
jgi:glycerol-3-phosphate dehydrogenase (NAD(P)+)